jgi:hypothetical protein
MRVILATWDDEIGRVSHSSRPAWGEKKMRDSHLSGKKLDVVVCACYPSYSRKRKIEES